MATFKSAVCRLMRLMVLFPSPAFPVQVRPAMVPRFARRLFSLLLVSALILPSLVACRREVRPEQPLDACVLLPRQTMEGLLGVPMQDAEPAQHLAGGGGRAALSSCEWPSTRGGMRTDGHKIRVRLMVWSWPEGSQGAHQYVRSMRENANTRRTASRTIDHLGEDAFWDGALHVADGPISLTLNVRPVTGSIRPSRQRGMERDLAKAVLDRL